MNGKGKVSIIITTYNLGEYIKETINCVRKQTYPNIEIIIVDDGSNDGVTSGILDSYEKDEKLSVIRIRNSGVSVARNEGVNRSTGEYLVFIDGDDLIDKVYVEKCVSVFENHKDAGFVYSISRLFGVANRIRPLFVPNYKKLLVYNNYFSVTCMLRRENFQKAGAFNPNMRYGIEDWEFFIRYCYEGMVIYRINEPLFFYRIRKNSRTKKVNSSAKATLQMRLEILRNNIDIYAKYETSLRDYRLTVSDKNSLLVNFKKCICMINLYKSLTLKKGKIERFVI